MNSKLENFIRKRAKELDISYVEIDSSPHDEYIMQQMDTVGIRVNPVVFQLYGKIPESVLLAGIDFIILHEKGHMEDSDVRAPTSKREEIANEYAWKMTQNPIESSASASSISYFMHPYFLENRTDLEDDLPALYPPHLIDFPFLTKKEEQEIVKRFREIVTAHL